MRPSHSLLILTSLCAVALLLIGALPYLCNFEQRQEGMKQTASLLQTNDFALSARQRTTRHPSRTGARVQGRESETASVAPIARDPFSVGFVRSLASKDRGQR